MPTASDTFQWALLENLAPSYIIFFFKTGHLLLCIAFPLDSNFSYPATLTEAIHPFIFPLSFFPFLTLISVHGNWHFVLACFFVD